MNINDCLSQIVSLTQQNISILKALNDSFYTKKNHIAVDVNGVTFTIPSFLSLENKIDILQQDLENILNAPKTGEVFTYFDGTTQKLELSGYGTTPVHVDLPLVSQFDTETNNIFKDFMSPNPFVKLDISSIPNSIKHINIKKIILHNPKLIELVNSITKSEEDSSCSSIQYTDLYKILYGYKIDVDYIEYNTIKRIPVRTNNAYGVYSIASIDDNYQDSNLDEHYVLTLNEDLKYSINSGTISRDIVPGDTLVTYNDKIQMVVEEVYSTARSIKVRIMYGAYANLCDQTSANSELYRLKFFQDSNWNLNKYINEPLEEDRYVCIFVAPINDTTNIQAPWGSGLYLNTDNLLKADDSTQNFRDYYKTYVNNIGDTLYAITHMITDDSQIEKLSRADFNTITEYKPLIGGENIQVTQINKHLEDSKNIKTIRQLYAQKIEYRNQLDVIQSSIDNLNNLLNTSSFDEQNNTRVVYETQLQEYNATRQNLVTSIESVVNSIKINVESSDLPIENAKYHIRGFIDVSEFEEGGTLGDLARVIGLDVEYRYRNKNSLMNSAMTIGDNYIYSDWTRMTNTRRRIVPKHTGNSYTYTLEPLNMNENNVSFNQIDIPITQGETVDIRVRYVYNLGFPFVESTSSWSTVYSVEFPEELSNNIEILDIIEENNSDIRKNQYTNTLQQYGLIDHASDTIQDQTIKYYHQPEHIASGFYTSERRVIPLKDKLLDIDTMIGELQTEVYGALGDNLIVSIDDGSNNMLIKPNVVNTFRTTAYNNNSEVLDVDDSITGDSVDWSFKYSQISISLYNGGEYQMKIHSIFPGDPNTELNPDTAISKYDYSDYCLVSRENELQGSIYMLLDDGQGSSNVISQHLNQIMYFRTQLNGSSPLYKSDNREIVTDDDLQSTISVSDNPQSPSSDIILPRRTSSLRSGSTNTTDIRRAAFLYPYPGDLNNICISERDSFIILKPGERKTIPLSFYYWFETDTSSTPKNLSVTRSISFDIRTSLFSDPINYKLNVTAYRDDVADYKTKIARSTENNTIYSINNISDGRILTNNSIINSGKKRR